ncbi:MAG: hypothetical protein COB02_08010 [Candidatus Cloacimonadota bacterium]|nr:MAG: hypothetical protein COB02_08010 [Candidatus Cloacimonadota bacterium]
MKNSLLFLFLIFSNSSFSAVKNICKTIQILQNLDQKKYSLLRSTASQKSVQKTISNLEDLRHIRTDEGGGNPLMRLKYSSLSQTQFGVVRVNIWVDEVSYQSQIVNLLNSFNGFTSFEAMKANRDIVIQDMGDTLRDIILPESVKVFGQFQDLVNSNSEGVNVYLYDISDNFVSNRSYVGGYFDPLDVTNSGNYMKAVHMDIFPNNPGGRGPIGLNPSNASQGSEVTKKDFYHVLVHEFQHLIHNQHDQNETIWLNEGLSQFAIYRIFHGKKFPSTGINILDTPADSPNQVKWWYGYFNGDERVGGPQTSHLMSFDEQGLSNSTVGVVASARQVGLDDPRSDTVEIRGIGYMFFSYLWEQLGGGFDISKQLKTSSSSADNTFLKIASSPLNGLSSIQNALSLRGLNINDLFNSFSIALYLKASEGSLAFNFFQNHIDGLNHQLDLNVTQNTLSLSPDMPEVLLGLDAYSFRFIHINGTTVPAVINVDGLRDFQATLFGLDSLGTKIIEYQNLAKNHSISIPKNQQRILLISNANLSFVDVSIKYIQSLSVSTEVITPINISTQFTQSILLNPVAINGFQIKKQVFTNNTGKVLDLLNPFPKDVQISACITGATCVHKSYLAVRPRQLSKSIAIGGTNYEYSNLSLNDGVSYDLFYANKTGASFTMTPRAIEATLFTIPKNPVPTILPDVDSSLGVSTGSGGCFLASASFLGKDSYEVRVLSNFRDNFLLSNSFGKLFVKIYYKYSPSIANWMKSESKTLIIGQFLLIPLVFLSSLLKLGLFHLFLLGFLIFLSAPFKNFRN